MIHVSGFKPYRLNNKTANHSPKAFLVSLQASLTSRLNFSRICFEDLCACLCLFAQRILNPQGFRGFYHGSYRGSFWRPQVRLRSTAYSQGCRGLQLTKPKTAAQIACNPTNSGTQFFFQPKADTFLKCKLGKPAILTMPYRGPLPSSEALGVRAMAFVPSGLLWKA